MATRFSSRDQGALSPGFLLALFSMPVFKRAGAAVWDLGQTDSNPIMGYKV